MSSRASTTVASYRWTGDALEPLDPASTADATRQAETAASADSDGADSDGAVSDSADPTIDVADSWLVTDGTALALPLHRSRFLSSIAARGFAPPGAEEFWDAAVAAIPRHGDWFPRVELHSHGGTALLAFRLREAPQRGRSLVLATHNGDDPRTAPRIKGPDLDALQRIRTEAQQRGADEAVLLSPGGSVVDGAHTALLWWRGDILCSPAPELDRVDSVTAKSTLALAVALGVDIYHEDVAPTELDGLEIWAVNALHGIRIVTAWVDGPQTAEEPGRLAKWRTLVDRLRKPLPPLTPTATGEDR
jgi:branched-subunit amino acid aminotransferase/4-amino-4-deoxychorismate lyase